MAANTTSSALALSNLDFEGIRSSFVTYLKGQDRFKDYDYEGSNISVILDLLSYNTYQNNFYLNMAVNEAFLDTAQTKDAVFSHSKELNYLPRSYKSAEAVVDITIVPPADAFGNYPSQIVLPKNTSFQSTMDNKIYSFSLASALTITSNGTYTASAVSIYEGEVTTENFNVTSVAQKYIISNPNIDTDSLSVNVRVSSSDSTNSDYTFASSLLNVKSTDKVFFLQGADKNRYEVVFGDGTFGTTPVNGNIVKITYRVSNGDAANGSKTFKPKGSMLGGYSNYYIRTISPASGGSLAETLDSIKFRAPRHYQTQERAVTTEDFRNILFEKYPEIRAIHVYGGETLNPPQYGKVIIVVDLKNVTGLPDIKKTEFTSYIKSKMLASITPVFIGPDYTYVKLVTDVKYNVNKTTLAPTDIQSSIFTTLSTFNYNYLDDFNTTLRYSQLVAAIDNTNVSISGTNTELQLIKKIMPVLNTNTSFSVSFQNQVIASTIASSSFTYNGTTCFIQDNGSGSLNITTIVNNASVVVVSGIGSIDYTTGAIVITNLNVSEYAGSGIKIYGTTVLQDFAVMNDTIIQMLPEDATVNVTAVRL